MRIREAFSNRVDLTGISCDCEVEPFWSDDAKEVLTPEQLNWYAEPVEWCKANIDADLTTWGWGFAGLYIFHFQRPEDAAIFKLAFTDRIYTGPDVWC